MIIFFGLYSHTLDYRYFQSVMLISGHSLIVKVLNWNLTIGSHSRYPLKFYYGQLHSISFNKSLLNECVLQKLTCQWSLDRQHSRDDNIWDVILNLPDCSHFLMLADMDIFVLFCTTFLVRLCVIYLQIRNVEVLMNLFQGLDTDHLVIEHIMVNAAPKMRRRTYRAHGRINRMYTLFTSIYSYREFIKQNPKIQKKYFIHVHVHKTWCFDADRNFTNDLCITIYLIEMF